MADLGLPAWAVVKRRRREHVARVVELLERWSRELGVGDGERMRWRRAALLHDALRDAPAEALLAYDPPRDWPERLWHGPAAATAAEREGERDRGVLDAVRYHSLGYAPWDAAGRMLYLADYLEPGRSRDRAALDELARRVPTHPESVVREVCARRLAWLIEKGTPIGRHTWEFWNSLVEAGSSSPD